MLFIFFTALSLSMDAFSLAIIYGTLRPKKDDIIKISCLIGIFHFFMPLFGSLIGDMLMKIPIIKIDLVVFAIFTFIGIEMLFEKTEEETFESFSSIYKILVLCLTVSLDSLGIGVGINSITDYLSIAYITFAFVSFIMSFIGFVFGKKIGVKIGERSKTVGGIVLILLGIIHLIK